MMTQTIDLTKADQYLSELILNKELSVKFLLNVLISDECWLWKGFSSTGVRNKEPYGYFSLRHGAVVLAHRASFVIFNNKIPTVVRHSCDNTLCVNPKHLLDGTQKENCQDMARKGRSLGRFKYTHCIHGHEYTPENTYIVPSSGYRKCRICLGLNPENFKT